MKRQKTSKLLRRIKELEEAIKLDCYDCMGGRKKLDCGIEECSLYPFRPFNKKR